LNRKITRKNICNFESRYFAVTFCSFVAIKKNPDIIKVKVLKTPFITLNPKDT
jgi:hypothetical protein